MKKIIFVCILLFNQAAFAADYKVSEAKFQQFKASGEYNRMFPYLLDMIKQDNMKNAVYLNNLIYLDTPNELSVWLSPKQLSETAQVLETIKSKYPVLNAQMKLVLKDIYVETGQLEKAKDVINSLGFITDWFVIGSFDNKDRMGYDEAYAPEEEIDLSKEYKGIRWNVKWKKLKQADFFNRVDLKNVLQPNEWTVAYALTYVYSPEALNAAIRSGGDDAYKVWLNDELVVADDTYKCYAPDQNVKGVHLKQGWNKLLVKVCQATGGWMFSLRITDPEGSSISGLKYSLDPSLYKQDEDSAVSEVSALSVAGHFSKNEDERSLYYLARWLRLKDMKKESIKAYEKLLEIKPKNAQYCMEAGIVYLNDGKNTKGLAQLKKSVDMDPQFAEAYFRIGKYYFAERLHKKAEEAFERVLEINPDFVEAHLYLGLIHDENNRLEKAYISTKNALEISPHLSWAHHNHGINALNKGYYDEAEASFHKAREYQYTYFGSAEALYSFYKYRGRFDEAVNMYKECQKLRGLEAGYYLGISECYLSQKKYAEAIEECSKALKISPEHYAVYTLLGRIHYDKNEPEETKQYWQTALKYKPDYVWLREYLDKVFPKKNPLFERYSIREEERKKIISAKIDKSKYPKASGAVLLDQAIRQSFGNGSSTQKVHMIIRVFNEAGREKYGQARLPGGDLLKIIRAVTITPDGVEVEPTEIQGGRISFASVDAGSTIEYEYTVDYFTGGWLKEHFYEYFFFQDQSAPILRSQYIFAAPKGKKVHTFVQGDNIKYKKERFIENDVYTWKAKNTEQIHSEAHRPPILDIISYVSVSTIPSWDYLAKWDYSLLKDQLEIDSSIREKIVELTKDKETLDEKIRALYNYITTDIRYVHRRGSRIFGVKPHKAVNVFADGFGVCKDKAILLIAMLKEIDVEAYYALLLTRQQGRTNKDIPIPHFNHAIVKVMSPKGDDGVFVDATSLYLSYGDLWRYNQGVDAFVYKAGSSGFVQTPQMPAERTMTSGDYTVTLNENGSIDVKLRAMAYGTLASSLRRKYRVKGTQKEQLESRINEKVSGAVLEEFSFSDLDDMDNPVEIKYSFNAPSFARKAGGKMYFKAMGSVKYAEMFTKKSTRIYDMKFYYKWMNNETQEFVLPENYKVLRVPADVALDCGFAACTIKYTQQPGRIIRKKEFALKEVDIKQKEYKRFRDFCVELDAAEEKEVELGKGR